MVAEPYPATTCLLDHMTPLIGVGPVMSPALASLRGNPITFLLAVLMAPSDFITLKEVGVANIFAGGGVYD